MKSFYENVRRKTPQPTPQPRKNSRVSTFEMKTVVCCPRSTLLLRFTHRTPKTG